MLKCTMIHSYPAEYFGLYQQFKEIGTFREWNNEVIKLAGKIENNDERNKFKGDMLEVFSELFFGQFSTDEALGITDYKPVVIGDDYGVDATGVNVNGHNVAIQVKYRSDPTTQIGYADIARTFTSAICQLHMDDIAQHDHTVYLFTNCYDVTGAFNNVMQKKAVIVSRDVISTKVDNNVTFWKNVYREVFETLDKE